MTAVAKHKPSKLTKKALAAYLDEVQATGCKALSAEVTGCSYSAVGEYRRKHPEFDAEVAHRMELYTQRLQEEARRRAEDGWVERPVFSATGEHVGNVHKFSDTLMMALLRKGDPAFRDKVTVDASASVATTTVGLQDLAKLSKEARGKLRSVLQELAGKESGS